MASTMRNNTTATTTGTTSNSNLDSSLLGPGTPTVALAGVESKETLLEIILATVATSNDDELNPS